MPSSSVKNCVGIPMGTVLHVWIAFDEMVIFTIYEDGGSFHLIYSSISSFNDLKFLSYNILPYQSRVDLKYFILFKALVKFAICLIFFSVCLLCV